MPLCLITHGFCHFLPFTNLYVATFNDYYSSFLPFLVSVPIHTALRHITQGFKQLWLGISTGSVF